jgi:hypothetical protein
MSTPTATTRNEEETESGENSHCYLSSRGKLFECNQQTEKEKERMK